MYLQNVAYSGKKTDVWCLGVVIYALLCCQFPFEVQYRRFCIAKGAHPEIKYPEKYFSPSAKRLLMKMLELNAEQRISMEEVRVSSWLKM